MSNGDVARTGGGVDRRWLVGLACAVALMLAAYAIAVNAWWVGDDYNYVVPKDWPTVLNFFNPVGRAQYRPLAWLSWAANWALFGADPLGWHLTSLALHAVNIVWVAGLVRALTGRPGLAVLAAGLFGIHPALAEAVTWTAARNEVIWAGLGLPALWLWVRWRKGGSRWNLVLAVLLAAGAILGKETAVLLPLLVLWIDLVLGRGWARWPGRRDLGWWRDGATWRGLLRDHAPFFAVSGLYVAGRAALVQAGLGQPMYGLEEQFAFLNRAPDVLTGYLLLIPGGWWLPQAVLAWPLAVKLAIIVGGAGGLLALAWWLGPLGSLAVGWLPLTLLLTTQGVSNRWFYMPAVGVALLAATLVLRLTPHPRPLSQRVRGDTAPHPRPLSLRARGDNAHPQPPAPIPHSAFRIPHSAFVGAWLVLLAWGGLTAWHNEVWREAGETARGLMGQVQALEPDPPRPATFYVANAPYNYQTVLLFNTGFKAAINLVYHDWTGIKSYDLAEPTAHLQAALADPAQVGPYPVFLRYEAGRIVRYPSLAALAAAK